MIVFVTPLDGGKYQYFMYNDQMVQGRKLMQFELEPSYLVDDLKLMICEKTGIIPEQQRLLFKDRQIEDGRTLTDYNIQNKSVITLVLRLRGD